MEFQLKKSVALSSSGFLFDSETGESFSLNQSGVHFLENLKEGKTKEEIKYDSLEVFDVNEKTFEKDYFDFISVLLSHQLIERL